MNLMPKGKVFKILGGIILLIAVGLFGWKYLLPQKAPTQPAPKSAKITIPCPTLTEFCQNAKPVFKKDRFVGLGAKISSGSAILAVFDGTVKKRSTILSKELGGETFTNIELIGTDLTARYLLKTNERMGGDVKKGQEITKVGEGIDYYDGLNLVFILVSGNTGPIPSDQFEFEK